MTVRVHCQEICTPGKFLASGCLMLLRQGMLPS
jgi:hypothetical protein